jgi:hypothetical protein
MFTVLKAAGMIMEYWPEAIQYWVYTFNRMPTKANPDYLSPYHTVPPPWAIAVAF